MAHYLTQEIGKFKQYVLALGLYCVKVVCLDGGILVSCVGIGFPNVSMH